MNRDPQRAGRQRRAQLQRQRRADRRENRELRRGRARERRRDEVQSSWDEEVASAHRWLSVWRWAFWAVLVLVGTVAVSPWIWPGHQLTQDPTGGPSILLAGLAVAAGGLTPLWAGWVAPAP